MLFHCLIIAVHFAQIAPKSKISLWFLSSWVS